MARLLVTAAAVALGVGLLLITLAGVNALHAQDVRTAWLSTSANNLRPSVDETRSDPLWGLANADEYRNPIIDRIDVAATGPHSPVPPGIPALPGAGRYYASPALARLLRTTPAAQLGRRYPGRLVGTIGPAALASPDSLVIVIGHSAAELSTTPGARQVRSFETAPQGTHGNSIPPGSSSSWPSSPAPFCCRCSSSSLRPPAWPQPAASSDLLRCASSVPRPGRCR